jgi:hypothetical protein
VEQLKRELASKQAELMAANAALTPTASSGLGAGSGPGAADAGAITRAAASTVAAVAAAPAGRVWTAAAILAALGIGFWLGYATLARRIKHKYGGLKVY